MQPLPMIETLSQWGPIFTRPEVWRPLIEEIWRRHRLGAIDTVEPGVTGWLCAPRDAQSLLACMEGFVDLPAAR